MIANIMEWVNNLFSHVHLPVADIDECLVKVNRTVTIATVSALDLVTTALTNSDDSLPVNVVLASSITNTVKEMMYIRSYVLMRW